MMTGGEVRRLMQSGRLARPVLGRVTDWVLDSMVRELILTH